MVSELDRECSCVCVPIPLPEERVFRNQAMDDIVELLYRNPHEEFGIRQLRSVTGHGAQTVDTAITLLGEIELIRTRRDGNRKLIGLNRDRIRKPDDPILEIQQEEFRTPVREFLNRVRDVQNENLVGVVLFGSVARGEADRASDIDVQVIVENDLPKSRRELHDVRQEIESERFDGERYELQLLVESVVTAESYGEKLREIFSEGITLYFTDELADVREAVFDGE